MNPKERQIREEIKREVMIPDSINERVRETYKLIKTEKYQKTNTRSASRQKIYIFKKIGMSAAAAVAAIAVLAGVCFTNPVLASKLPFIGHLFEQVQTDVSYKGDFSANAEQLVSDEDSQAVEAGQETDNQYIQKAGNITITVSEATYTKQAIYLALNIYNEDGFPEDFNRTQNMNEYILNYDVLSLNSKSDFSFAENYTSVDPYQIEGRFEDANTFVGIVRVDIGHMEIHHTEDEIQAAGIDVSDMSYDEEYLKKVQEVLPDEGTLIEVPDNFHYTLQIDSIWGELEETTPEIMTDPDTGEEITINEPVRKEYAGTWKFDFDFTVDDMKQQTIEVNDTNENGYGLEKVVKSPYEVTAYTVVPENTSSADVFMAICDADGDLLDFQGSNCDNYQIYGRNTDKVTIFLCDYDEYMDELKGYYWSEDYATKKQTKTFAQYLEEHCLYSKTVEFQ